MTRQQTVAELETALATARQSASLRADGIAAWQREHDALVDAGAPEADLQQSRDKGARLRMGLEEAQAKMGRDEQRLAEGRALQTQNERAVGWTKVERLLEQRHALARGLQAHLDDVAAALAELIEMNERVVAAIPDRPTGWRPARTLAGAVTASAEAYLFGRSEGRMCKQGSTSVHKAQQAPDLAELSRELAAIVFTLRPTKEPA